MRQLNFILIISSFLATGCFAQDAITNPVNVALIGGSTSSSVYIVQRGDTASKIAKAHHLTVQQLQTFNFQVYISDLKVGQKLYLDYLSNAV
jgi:LysM repeat protein